ncbi:23S rRNA (uracil(1939)-C(5))-methyltransferase RlmD [Alicyclobacillus sp. SP_1]|uniref:23S rRNA (uracil(1939)-C(5))-methyltransferase RlmD n=1 Tax=Alicyclobacillus sp. SP_1 TaxID=2942475 RepID=UPI002157F63B|nr:23S rRNA (uracil(1939)-C(5))-methyltransferase RlmD [Alicyclobacillus sp. SP_1]
MTKSDARAGWVGQLAQVTATRLNDDGDGVAKIGPLTVFVPQLLPGEFAQIRVTSAHRNFLRAELVEIQGEFAQQRDEPVCPVFGRCGGCQLQHMEYAEQLEHKRQVTAGQLRRALHQEQSVRRTLASPFAHRYRNHVQIPVAWNKALGRLQFGFYHSGSHDMVETPTCHLISTEMEMLWSQIRDEMATWPEQLASAVHHLSLRESGSTGALAVIWSVDGWREAVAERLLRFYERHSGRHHGVWTAAITVQRRFAATPYGQTLDVLAGPERLTERILGRTYQLSLRSFLQVNHYQTPHLYETVRAALREASPGRVLDAFCGVGTMSLLLAEVSSEVVGVDYLESNIADAHANAMENGVSNVRFVSAAVEDWLPERIARGEKFDTVVVDPPRKGLPQPALAALLALRPRSIIYVSCNPATLARDLAALTATDYALDMVQPVDMFPQTSHVECCISTYRVD